MQKKLQNILIGLITPLLIFTYNNKLYSQDLSIKYLTNQNYITIGTDNWYPYEYGHPPQGLCVDIIEEATKRLNIKIKYESMLPWTRALNKLKNNNLDIVISGTWNKKRNQIAYFENLKPITHFQWSAYSSSKNARNQTIGYVKDYNYPHELKEKFSQLKIQFVNSNEILIKMLNSNRIDIGLFEKSNAKDLINKMNLTLNELENTTFISPAFPLINKKWQHKEKLVDIINQMHEDGSIEKIHKKWNIDYIKS